MPTINSKRLQLLYSSGLSMSDIAREQQVSLHKISYWMDKYHIARRSYSDATYIKRNPKGDPFKIVLLDTDEKKKLFYLGIGLFLGEGSKKNQNGLRLANSNPEIIKLFLKFLRTICGVESHKIQAEINIFDDLHYNSVLEFWSDMTGISKNNFYRPTIRPQKVGSYKNKSSYGTITILVNNKKLYDQMMIWCQGCLQ